IAECLPPSRCFRLLSRGNSRTWRDGPRFGSVLHSNGPSRIPDQAHAPHTPFRYTSSRILCSEWTALWRGLNRIRRDDASTDFAFDGYLGASKLVHLSLIAFEGIDLISDNESVVGTSFD